MTQRATRPVTLATLTRDPLSRVKVARLCRRCDIGLKGTMDDQDGRNMSQSAGNTNIAPGARKRRASIAQSFLGVNSSSMQRPIGDYRPIVDRPLRPIEITNRNPDSSHNPLNFNFCHFA